MPSTQFSDILNPKSSSIDDTVATDPLDGAVSKLVVQAAFLQAFAEGLADWEQPAEAATPDRAEGEIDSGWRAGLRF
ncbi:MAG: hypothetical protein ACI9MB_002873 [Verrucomicrobiales bacterium]|jgi:hypothetical protein